MVKAVPDNLDMVCSREPFTFNEAGTITVVERARVD
jgi:hypothetical protein